MIRRWEARSRRFDFGKKWRLWNDLRWLKQLEEKNHGLKRLVPDLSLDKTLLQDMHWKKICGLIVVAGGSLISGKRRMSAKEAPVVCLAFTKLYFGTKIKAEDQVLLRLRI